MVDLRAAEEVAELVDLLRALPPTMRTARLSSVIQRRQSSSRSAATGINWFSASWSGRTRTLSTSPEVMASRANRRLPCSTSRIVRTSGKSLRDRPTSSTPPRPIELALDDDERELLTGLLQLVRDGKPLVRRVSALGAKALIVEGAPQLELDARVPTRLRS